MKSLKIKIIFSLITLLTIGVGILCFTNNQGNNSSQNNTPPSEVAGTLIKADITSKNNSLIKMKHVFGNEKLKPDEIKTITFESTLENCLEDSWDASAEKNGSIKAWIVKNENLYDLYIASDGKIAAPQNSDNLFFSFRYCTTINFGECFDTSNVTSMNNMFSGCGLTSLDVSSFDTSNVTSMVCMFFECSSLISLDLNRFDTSNVTAMDNMFCLCRSLETKPQITIPNDASTEEMFLGTKWE